MRPETARLIEICQTHSSESEHRQRIVFNQVCESLPTQFGAFTMAWCRLNRSQQDKIQPQILSFFQLGNVVTGGAAPFDVRARLLSQQFARRQVQSRVKPRGEFSVAVDEYDAANRAYRLYCPRREIIACFRIQVHLPDLNQAQSLRERLPKPVHRRLDSRIPRTGNTKTGGQA